MGYDDIQQLFQTHGKKHFLKPSFRVQDSPLAVQSLEQEKMKMRMAWTSPKFEKKVQAVKNLSMTRIYKGTEKMPPGAEAINARMSLESKF